jgi:tRNA threonylcarbamoyladenosine biosynthesis protein TsaB
MLVLALDTTTRQGSVALARDGSLLAVAAGDAGVNHGARLPGDLARVLDAQGLRMTDVDLFAVAAGPGSFTGLRIGIATMQGLALGNGKPLAGVSALDAIFDSLHSLSPPASAPQSGATARLAEARRTATDDERRRQPSGLSPAGEVGVWMDAGRGQVFSAVYNNGDDRESALVDKPDAILTRWASARSVPRVYAGDGAIAYADLIRAAVPGALIVDPVPPLAPSVARLAEAHVRAHGPAAPDAVRPVYIRRPDVELARERKAELRE